MIFILKDVKSILLTIIKAGVKIANFVSTIFTNLYHDTDNLLSLED